MSWRKFLVASGVLCLLGTVVIIGGATSTTPEKFCTPDAVIGADGRFLPDAEQPLTKCLRKGQQEQAATDRRQERFALVGSVVLIVAAALGVTALTRRTADRRGPT